MSLLWMSPQITVSTYSLSPNELPSCLRAFADDNLRLSYIVDMESIDALVAAVRDFRGGLMVVSHDEYFITNTCRDLWVVGDGKAAKFKGHFDDYKEETLARTAKRVAQSVKALSSINN